jgi:maintenance of morphology protein 1
MDVDLSDVITLGIETTLVLNYPKPLVAVLPVALAVSVVRFSGTLAVSFIPSSSPPPTSTNTPDSSPAPHTHQRDTSTTTTSATTSTSPHRPESSNSTPPPHRPTTLAFTFLDDYRLDLSVRSLVGSRSRLQDVPKIAQLIESRVHAWFDERAVEPRFQQIVLPSLWPRKRNTRGGEGVDGEGEEGGLVTPGGGDGDGREADGDGRLGAHGGSEARDFAPSREMPSSFVHRAAAAPTQTLEERIEAEGAKLRDAEIRAGERKRESLSTTTEHSRERERERDGMRWRGDRDREQRNPLNHQRDRSRQTSRNRFSGEWSGQKGMPGAMASG